MINEEVIRLRISIQNALIGKITKEVREVYVKIKNNCIYLYIIVDGETSDYLTKIIILAKFDQVRLSQHLIF